MMNIFKIAFSNIKKRKSSALTFFAIVAMSALMLCISLSLLLNAGSFYDNKREELNSGDIFVTIAQNNWDESIVDFVDNYSGIKNYEINNCYIGELKYFGDNNQKNKKQFLVSSSADINSKTINKVNLIDEQAIYPQNHIFLPLSYNLDFTAGKKIFLESSNELYEFTVAGFFEDAQLGASTMGVKNIYVDRQSYDKLASDPTFFYSYILAIQFDSIDKSYSFETEFAKTFSLDNGIFISYETAKTAHTMFPLIMSFVLIVVASIVLTIALIIVRFNINSSILEDMRNLGALKSIGFTSWQIILSIVLQFLILSFLGSVLGVLLGGLSSGYIGNIVTATGGLLWSSNSVFAPSLIAIIAICSISAITTFLTSKKTKSITPIMALRGNTQKQSFKRNYAPLHKTKMPLNLALSVKSLLTNIKNNITSFVVVTLFAFLTVLGFTLYNGFVKDTSTFIQMLGLEPAQAQIGIFDEADKDILEQVAAHESVTKLVNFGTFPTTVEGKMLAISVFEDITQKELNSLVQGRNPLQDNEITLLSSSITILEKKIGDTIEVEYAGIKNSFIIVGVLQGVSGDVNSIMTLEGFKRFNSNDFLNTAFIYLNQTDSEFVDEFIGELRQSYGNKIYAINYKDLIDGTLIALRDPIAVVTYLVVAINISTIVFVFFLLVSTIIRRKNKDLGIMKALGFTTSQLIKQILISFLPSILLGLIFGSILGILLTNPMLGLMFSGLGVTKAIFAIPMPLIIIMQHIILATCIATICLISLKIKRISPKSLITE